MKKGLYITLFLLVSIISLAMLCSASPISVDAGNNIEIEEQDGVFYLPSCVTPQAVNFNYSGSVMIDQNGEKVPLDKETPFDLTEYQSTDETGAKCYALSVFFGSYEKKLRFYFASSLPSIHVTTSKGGQAIVRDNDKDESTQIVILNKDGTVEYADGADELSKIKVRGNTTNSYAKKPFAIKLGHKAPLFEMSNDRQWILLANYLDQSLIRNSIMYQIANILGMDMCDFKSVDLYLDGEYYGVYLLCEKVEIDNGRVNIRDLEEETELLNPSFSDEVIAVTSGELINNTILTEYRYVNGITNPSDITGGYLIELDNNYYKNELCYFVTENNSHYVIKSPEKASKEQVEYIATLFAEMEEAIMSQTGKNRLGKHYSEYIDVDSFVYAYIIAELSRNYDAGSSSMYFYKDWDQNGELSKIVKGPLWDCDNTLGNIHKNGASSSEGYWARNRSIWSGLCAKQEFNQKVTSTFAKLYDDIFDMLDAGGFIDKQLDQIGTSVNMERMRWKSYDYSCWPTYFDGTHYDRWQSAPVFNFVEVYSDGVNNTNQTVIGYLCNHIEKRANWLAEEWDCQVTVRQRVLNDPPPPNELPSAQPNINPALIIVSIVAIVAVVVASACVVIAIIKRK